MIDLKKYTRVAFHVDAVQVTADNIGDVADWCGGDVRTTATEDEHGVKASPYIKVRVKRPLTPRQTKAFIGDWVLYAGTGFKVYTDNAFQKCFEPIGAIEWVKQVDESGDMSGNDLSVEELLTEMNK